MPGKFFESLASLFSDRRAKSHGSIFLSQKRRETVQIICMHSLTGLMSIVVLPAGTKAPTSHDDLSDLAPLTAPLPILIRASNNKPSEWARKRSRDARRVKLSTTVEAGELDTFYARYAECCKAGATALKKRDKKKSKAAAKKKKTKPVVAPAT